MSEQSENIADLATALAKAQGMMSPALKDCANPFFKSKYADLTSVWEACRNALSVNGLAVIQTTKTENEKLILITTLAHASGQWVRSILPVLTAKNDAQGQGAGITYARRFALAALVGVCPEDDDGNTASNVSKKEPVKESPNPRITIQEGNELKAIVSECSDEYKKAVNKLLKDQGINSVFDLNPQTYATIRSQALVKRAEFIARTETEVAHVA